MELDDEDYVYPTSPRRLFMMRALAIGLGMLLLLMLVFALVL